jgi:hypothetical protein
MADNWELIDWSLIDWSLLVGGPLDAEPGCASMTFAAPGASMGIHAPGASMEIDACN